MSAWHMHNLSVHDDLLVVLTSALVENYWKKRCYIDIWEYSVLNEKEPFVLTFSFITLQYIKNFIHDFLHKQLLHLPFEHKQVAILL